MFVSATLTVFCSWQKVDIKPRLAVQPSLRADEALALPLPVVPVEIHHDVSMKEEELCQAFSEALIEDIDEGDGDQPQLCSEYVKDIYAYLHGLEVKYCLIG